MLKTSAANRFDVSPATTSGVRHKLYIHDYAGHVSQMEVARALAGRGHDVTFTYCHGLSTPRAQLAQDERLRVRPISIGRPIIKGNYVVRQWQDVAYGKALVKDLRSTQCDIVLSCNTPLFPEAALLRECQRRNIPLVHWWSEVYSHAVHDGLRKKSKLLAAVVGGFYRHLEKRLLSQSNAVISVCHGAAEIAKQWNVSSAITVIPVAAPVDSIRPVPKDNPWARDHGLQHTLNIVYAGTLGIKHRPEFLSRLARDLRSQHDVRVIVVSEGPGARFLKQQKAQQGLENLLLFPFQPFEEYIHVLGTADIQVTMLHEEASKYSLPSKFASQLCSGKPQVAVVPRDNDAAEMISEAEAGLISEPDDYEAFKSNVIFLLESESKRDALGMRGRAYVEHRLTVEQLVPRYEAVIRGILPPHAATDSSRDSAISAAQVS